MVSIELCAIVSLMGRCLKGWKRPLPWRKFGRQIHRALVNKRGDELLTWGLGLRYVDRVATEHVARVA